MNLFALIIIGLMIGASIVDATHAKWAGMIYWGCGAALNLSVLAMGK